MYEDWIADDFAEYCTVIGSIVTLQDENGTRLFRLVRIRQRPGSPELIYQSMDDGKIYLEMELPHLAYDTLESGGHVYANGHKLA